MAEHDCKHEADLAVVLSDVRDIKAILGRVERILVGNGAGGLVTKVEVFRTAQVRAFAWLGGLTVAIVGFGVWLIQSGHWHLIGQ